MIYNEEKNPNILYVENTPYNLEKLKNHFKINMFLGVTILYFEINLKTKEVRMTFEHEWLYRNQPITTPVDDVIKYFRKEKINKIIEKINEKSKTN